MLQDLNNYKLLQIIIIVNFYTYQWFLEVGYKQPKKQYKYNSTIPKAV